MKLVAATTVYEPDVLLVLGVEVVAPVNRHLAAALDAGAGTDGRTHFVRGSLLVRGDEGRVIPLAGLGLTVRAGRFPGPFAHVRAGVIVRIRDRWFIRSEVTLDGRPPHDGMAAARLGLGYGRF